ncbi:hypothetical protein GE09DRAFT_1092696 [Coniochaeta sp. 2T2.1]|nr:hypothetical protein GE09DRAFT_1092696 [Coniochaeta sp. 2T2.1]
MRRAARRVWMGNRVGGSEEGVGGRCLGAEIVHRAWKGRKKDAGTETKWREGEIAGWRQEEERRKGKGIVRQRERRGSLEGVVPVCNSVGRFERLGSEDMAFVCDYCDGFMVWPNLAEVPDERSRPGSLTAEGYPNWAARGRRCTVKEEEEETKDVVFAPLAIANHVPPRHGEWMSRIVCPYCEEYTYIDSGDDGDGERKWTPEQEGFESVERFGEHLAWSHSAMAKPGIPGLGDKCAVM